MKYIVSVLALVGMSNVSWANDSLEGLFDKVVQREKVETLAEAAKRAELKAQRDLEAKRALARLTAKEAEREAERVAQAQINAEREREAQVVASIQSVLNKYNVDLDLREERQFKGCVRVTIGFSENNFNETCTYFVRATVRKLLTPGDPLICKVEFTQKRWSGSFFDQPKYSRNKLKATRQLSQSADCRVIQPMDERN